jgi:hypothetical protein
MRWSIYLLAVIVASCTTFSREKEQQSKIDSLTNELKRRDSVTKKQVDTTKEEIKKDTVVIQESADAVNASDVKEIVAKKKEQKNTELTDQKDHEGKNDDSVKDDQVKTEEPESHGSVDERNAVLKKVVTDEPTFKPLLFGGFKDIKFYFSNRYPYRLDQVILKVHYIREDGTEIKAETKILKDVAPNSTLALTAPDHTTSGKKLRVTVEAVQCRAIDLCFYSSEPVRSMDPYRCR